MVLGCSTSWNIWNLPGARISYLPWCKQPLRNNSLGRLRNRCPRLPGKGLIQVNFTIFEEMILGKVTTFKPPIKMHEASWNRFDRDSNPNSKFNSNPDSKIHLETPFKIRSRNPNSANSYSLAGLLFSFFSGNEVRYWFLLSGGGSGYSVTGTVIGGTSGGGIGMLIILCCVCYFWHKDDWLIRVNCS